MIPKDIKDGVSFEYYVQQVFLSDGIQALTTPTTNDYGSDLIVKYNGFTFSIQCKYYTNPVGIKAVQEVMGSLKYYEADYGAVITNSIFTQQAKNLARTNGILLIDSSCDFYSFKDYFDSFLNNASDQKTSTKTTTEWTLDDLVIRYGVSKNTVLRNYLSAGLPYTKVGREYRFDSKQVAEWEIEQGAIRYGRYGVMRLPAYREYIEKKLRELDMAKKEKDYDKYVAIQKDLKDHGYTEFDAKWVWPVLFIVGMAAIGLAIAFFLNIAK